MWKKYIKLFVKKVASIFNERIELSLLYITYLCFTSIKDIFQKINNFLIKMNETKCVMVIYSMSHFFHNCIWVMECG